MEPVQKKPTPKTSAVEDADPTMESSLEMLAKMKAYLFEQFKKRSDHNGWGYDEGKALETAEKLAHVIDVEARIKTGVPRVK